MKLFQLFIHRAPNAVFASIVFGAMAGICYALLIPLVMVGIESTSVDIQPAEVGMLFGFEIYQFKIATVFFVMCSFILLSRTYSQVSLLRISLDVTTQLRIKLYEQISASSIADLEKLGAAKLIAAISNDVSRIVAGARVLPDLLISGVTIVGMLGFLSYLNSAVFWIVIQVIVFGILSYQIPIYFANRYFRHSRLKIDALQEAIHGLVLGAKELKLDQTKRENYYREVLMDNEYAVLSAEKNGNTITRLATNYGDMISFFVIGVVAFVLINYHSISAAELTGVIMALLYITTPIALVINTIPQLVIAKISLNKVDTLLQELNSESARMAIETVPEWQKLKASGVVYQHRSHSDEPGFEIGPIDLEIKRGEITFIVGGNGSGKSTFSKILSLHYQAKQGSLYFDDVCITEDNINSYRQRLSTIYSDYYLFDRLLGEKTEQEESKIETYLKLLKLENKVTVNDRKFSTRSLSDGQRKRLALLTSLMDEKDLYLFDEWAADQDPTFKEIFYCNFIHELKAQGKAVIIISHDDRYFSQADKVVYMEQGKVRSVKQNESQLPEEQEIGV